VSLAERRWLRLFTLCILYVAQGIPWGFMATTLPAYIKHAGVPDAAVGSALAMTTLPYTFKWVWGPVMDLFTIPSLGRRRPWIMFAQLMMALTVIVIITIPDLTQDLELLAVMILIHTVFNSMQDVATDALGVDLLGDDERGRANGLMYACKYGGGIIGGAGLGRVIAAAGLPTALVVQTAILLAIGLVPLLVRERSGPPAPSPRARQIVEALAQVATIRSTLIVAIVMVLLYFALGVVTVTAVGLYTVELGWKPEKYTDLVGGLGLVAGFGGSILGGFLADWFGRKRVIAAASVGMGVGWVVFASGQSQWANDAFVYPLAVWEVSCQSIMTVATFALCMDVSWPRIAATQFTAYMALSNLGSTLGYKLAATVTDRLDYQQIYLAAAAFQIGATALLLVVDPNEARRKLPLAPGWKLNATGIVTALVFVVTVALVPVLLVLM